MYGFCHTTTQISYIYTHTHTHIYISVQFSSVAQSCPTLRDPMNYSRPGCPSPTPGVHPDSRPSSQWCHPAISSSVIPLSSCPQSLPTSESFPMSQLFTWGGQSTGVSTSASFPPKKSQGIYIYIYIYISPPSWHLCILKSPSKEFYTDLWLQFWIVICLNTSSLITSWMTKLLFSRVTSYPSL